MNTSRVAAAAAFACGAALAFAPLAAADTTNEAASYIDTVASALPAAATPVNIDISFDGYQLYNGMGTAVANTGAAGNGNFDFAIAYGDHASAYAAGGFGDSASAFGTYALADAGSKATGATGFNFDSATDIGNNVNPATYVGAPDGAYAGGASLIGGTDATTASSNDTAQFIGNAGIDPNVADQNGGNSGAFAGDSGLIGYNHVAGSGDTAYTSGNILGANDGSAAVGGTGDSAYTNGTETGTNEGAFSAFGNYNSATADTNYTLSNHGVSTTFGNDNYASVYGPNNSTGHAGGVAATAVTPEHDGSGNVAIVSDPFGTTADSANAGSTTTASGNSDLAEVLLTHGNASATGGSNLYDILSLFGNFHSASLPAAADPALVAPVDLPAGTVASEISSENSLFQFDASLAGVPSTDYSLVGGFDQLTPAKDLIDAPQTGTPSPLDYLVYGFNPIHAGVADPTGSFNVFNGAETKFDDAYNVALYAAENHGALLPVADVFGNHLDFVTGAGATAASAFENFYNFGIGDLSGFFNVDLSAFDITPAMSTELITLLGSL
ncbi:hypothetical protein [Mycobacterium sp.]|uniref:hypothetical protein n=1 Tax=Mycobacterium sp. TaxID=1785 RepID=UPI003D1194D2